MRSKLFFSSISQEFFWKRAIAVALIAVMLLAFTPALSASANVTNYYSPTKAVSHGPGWSNSIYALASDNLYARATKNNKQLKLSSFYIPAIPGNAIIDGIEVTVEGMTSGPQADVAVGGPNFSTSKLTTFGSSETILTLGGPKDTWGKTWTATDFQNKFTVKLTVNGTGGALSIDAVRVKVYFTPPNTTLVLNPVSGNWNGTADMTATLTKTATGEPLAGRTVNFSLNGVAMGSATTNASGVASRSGLSLAGIIAGDYPYGAAASFAGDPPWEATSITADLRVYGLGTTLVVSPISGPYRGTTGTITATLTETISGAPISGKTIYFTLDDFPQGSAITDSLGVASIPGVSLDGYDAGSYAGALEATYAGELNVEPAVGVNTLTVMPLELTVTGGLIPGNKVYDGTTATTLTIGSPTLNGVVSPDNATLNTSGATATFDDPNAGTGKTVHISGLTLNGTEAGNYTIVQPIRQADIAKATPTLSVANSPVIYDGVAHAATISSSVPGIVSNILTGGAATQTNTGTYAVTADFAPTDATNYNSLTAAAAGNFVIIKGTPVLSVTNSPAIYDGTAHAAIVSSSVPGIISNTLTGGAASQTNVGTYAVTADFVPTDTVNYNSLIAASAGDFVIQVDNTSPTVSSIVRADPNYTSAPTVKFTVLFSEPVTDADTGDFSLDNAVGMVAGATINSVIPADNTCAAYCNTYTVTVDTGMGNGTLRLDVRGTATITDLAGNPLGNVPFTNGEIYTVIDILNGMGDFNGDGKAEIAVFRPSESKWYIGGVGAFPFGTMGDIPVVGDYNGDGKDDIAIFRPSESKWYIGGIGVFPFGTVGDIPVVGDYNGDGKDDIAIFRPSTSTWYVGGVGVFPFGTVGDIPVVADYNGDGKDDIAIFRPSTSTWYVGGVGVFPFGTVGDIPVVADYNGDGKADIAIFRPSESKWYIGGIGVFPFGTVGDIPV